MSLRVSLARMPLTRSFSNSRGTLVARNALILELRHAGVEAFSECVTDEAPSCTGEDNSTALLEIRGRLGQAVRGEPPEPAKFLRAFGEVEKSQMARAAVEMLLWDYEAKRRSAPLDRVLGESRGLAEAGVAIGLGSEDEVKSQVGAALERGYGRVKVKIERKEAYKILAGIRDSFPEVPLSADANGCFVLPKDISALKRLDRFGLEYLEQPLGFDDLRGHAELARELSTPICLDESVTSERRAEEALDLEAAKVINVKPGRVGGIATALKITKMARARGAHVWVGGMLETGVGRAFNVALASQRLVDYPGDTSPNDRYFERDIVKNPFTMKGGKVCANAGPGIGIELDRDFLTKVTVKSWKVF